MGPNMLAQVLLMHFVVKPCTSIVGGGIEAAPNEFPWAVRLEGCGGSLISRRHILTAAHCLTRFNDENRSLDPTHPDKIWIYLGGHTGPVPVTEPNSVFYSKIKNILLPFNDAKIARALKWDLALLEIEPVNFTSNIQPIKIAKNKPPVGESVTLAGWGFLNRSKPAHALHKIDLQVINECDYYSSVTGQFCARHPNAETELRDACIGDSGSPLMYKSKDLGDEWRLTGVMSAGFTSALEDCEKLGGYSAYSDVSHPLIRSWLSKTIGEEMFSVEDTTKES